MTLPHLHLLMANYRNERLPTLVNGMFVLDTFITLVYMTSIHVGTLLFANIIYMSMFLY